MNKNYSNVDKKIWTGKYVHEDHAYYKNNAGYVNVGSFPQQIWCRCKLKKCVDEQLCANVQSLVIKQPILSQNKTQSKRKRCAFHFVDIFYFVEIKQENE